MSPMARDVEQELSQGCKQRARRACLIPRALIESILSTSREPFMIQKRVLVLQHIEIDPPGYLGELLQEHFIPYDVVMVQEGPLPDPTAYGAILSLGGPEYAGDEELSYLIQERSLIRRAVDQDIPFLGICLGGQLLASALGAPIVRKGFTEIGF